MGKITVVEIILRLLASAGVGFALGIQRARSSHPAGVRTHTLVAFGSCVVMITSCIMYYQTVSIYGATPSDPARLGAQVINGIGFLGAGTILVTGRQQVKGLTTAAGLWASACTGLAVGAGFYECVLIAFAMIFLSIRLFPIVDAYIQENARDINLYMEFHSLGDISTIINQLKAQNVQIYDIDIERNKSGEALHPSAIFSIRLNEKIPHTQLLSDLAELDCLCVIEEL